MNLESGSLEFGIWNLECRIKYLVFSILYKINKLRN